MLNTQVKKPKERYSREKYQALSPMSRMHYVEGLILDFINLNAGITVAEVQKELDMAYETVVKHVSRLEAIGDIYRKTYGKTNVYFGNHKNIHPTDMKEFKFMGTVFAYSILENQLGKFLFIQEKITEPNGIIRTRGGIMIPEKAIPSFFDELTKFLKQHYKKESDE